MNTPEQIGFGLIGKAQRLQYCLTPRMMGLLVGLTMSLLLAIVASAQTSTAPVAAPKPPAQWPKGISFTATGSIGGSEQALALSGLYNFNIAFRKRFKIGLGLRSSSYWGQGKYFETAPASLTTNQEGPQVIFVPSIPQNIDSIKVGQSYTQSINAYLNLEYAISSKFDIGFNIDLAGITIGSASDISLVSSYVTNASSVRLSAKPTFDNLLLTSDNDKGSLNSEIYARYHVNDRWAIVGGASFLFSELKTDQKNYNFGNDRFRRKALLGTIGVTWYPFR